MPQLQDPNFKRTVVLLVQHDESGTFGLVLNRELEFSAFQLCSSLDVSWKGDPSASISWGGPVQPHSGWVLFNQDAGLVSDPAEISQVFPELYFAGSLDVLRAVAAAPPPEVRLFLGYAGWGPGQLETELAEGAWLVAPLSTDLVFAVSADSMWNHAVRRLGIDPATLISTSGVH
jgi:putative transcriptional regulator